MKLLIEFAVTFIGLIIVIILCKKVISGIKTWNSAAERKKEQKSDVSACPQCGHKIIVGRRFCEKCGCAFTAMQEPH